MKKRLLLLIILLIFVISSISFMFIINYLDPYEYRALSISFILFSFILGVSSFFALILFFFKKVYYRGNVLIGSVINSFRQGFLISLYIIGLIVFNRIGVGIFGTGILLFIFLFFIELLIQNISE